ncbi:MAG: lysophospholipid acyltransferase family protein [Bacteroidetes bacterium]|nr:lysophospholipid acyltransferase family protein [Bacteroidota bacterium]
MSKKLQNYIEYFIFLLLKAILKLIPRVSYNLFSKLIGNFIFLIFSERKKIAIQNIKSAFPNFSENEVVELAKKSFQSVTITALEFLALSKWNSKKISKIIKITNAEELQKGLQKGNGVILIGGHYANWEIIIPSCTLHYNLKINIVVQEQSNKLVDNVINQIRTQVGNETISMDKAPKRVLQLLKENKIIAMLGDQSGKQDGLFVDFFRKKTSTHRGPAIFALRSNAEIYFMQNIRLENGSYELTFINISYDDIDQSKSESTNILTQRITNIIEQHIRKYPSQWLWMHKRWKHSIN